MCAGKAQRYLGPRMPGAEQLRGGTSSRAKPRGGSLAGAGCRRGEFKATEEKMAAVGRLRCGVGFTLRGVGR